jgi:Salmonella virulence plasmid 65kDa B protein
MTTIIAMNTQEIAKFNSSSMPNADGTVTVNIPGVRRKTSRGSPRYTDDRDTFLLSGAEDLVPFAETTGTTRYRPRTEGLFARIEHRRDTDTDHWEVRSKDGLVSVYGTPQSIQNDPAVVANPENRSQIFSWNLTETKERIPAGREPRQGRIFFLEHRWSCVS